MMQIAKWGNSLAIRLPAQVVNTLNLKEGDDIEVRIADDLVFKISKKPTRTEKLDRLRHFRGKLPRDFTWDREDANVRN